MNQEQKFTVNQAEAKVKFIRHTLAELDGFGWKATEPTKALQGFDAYRDRLAANAAAIDSASPLEKDGKGKFAQLLSEENLFVESLGKLATEAAQALTDEEFAFFAARSNILAKFREQTEEADIQIEQGLTWFVEGLQIRWATMLKKQELARRFADISQRHNTPESFGVEPIGLPKPFKNLNSSIWPAFVGSFLGRLGAVLPNMETTSPADVIKTIFEKP